VYFVPLAPAICVEVGVAADGPVATADVAEEVAELEACPALVAWLHPAPVSATTAIAVENAAVRFVIARISFLSNWTGSVVSQPKRGCRWIRDRGFAGSKPNGRACPKGKVKGARKRVPGVDLAREATLSVVVPSASDRRARPRRQPS
jgi:hypothetical protein